LTCAIKSNFHGMIESSISMVKAKVPFKCPSNLQDPSTSVPYEPLIKLPPHVKMLICEAHKADPSNELCKHAVDIITTDDLSPDIYNLEISGYQDKANIDNGGAESWSW